MRILFFCLSIGFYFLPVYGQGTPELVWTFSTSAPIYGSPIVANGTLFFGSCDGYFYAIDNKNGIEKWKVNTFAEIRSTAIIIEGQIYFTNGAGSLYCLDAKTGQIAWIFKTAGEKKYPLFSFADYYQSSPAFDNGLIYFGSGNGNIYAVDAKSGKEKWHYKTGAVVHASPVVKDGKLYIGSFDGYFYSLTTSGNILWKFKSVGHRFFPVGEFQGSAAVFGSQVFVGSRDYNLYALDTAKGFCHWNMAFTKGWAMGLPVIHDSILYVGTSDDKLLMALDPVTGRTIWKADVKFNVFGGVAVKKSTVFIGTLMGKLFSIDSKTGNINWYFETAACKKNRLTYFNGDDSFKESIFGTLIQKNEDFISLYYSMGAIFSTPAIEDDRLVFTSTEGIVYCLKLN